MQWKHFRPEKFPAYKRLIDYFVEENTSQRIDYSCIVIERRGLDHSRYNDGDGEVFFQKMMYQIALSLVRKYHFPRAIRLFHGVRASRFDLAEIQKIMNAGVALERFRLDQAYGYSPIKQLEYMNPGTSGPHQLADTLLGATSYYCNIGQQRRGDSRKRMLAEYFNAECCVDFLGKPTGPSKPQFNIWKLRLRERGPRA
jgi:hypothetical protein